MTGDGITYISGVGRLLVCLYARGSFCIREMTTFSISVCLYTPLVPISRLYTPLVRHWRPYMRMVQIVYVREIISFDSKEMRWASCCGVSLCGCNARLCEVSALFSQKKIPARKKGGGGHYFVDRFKNSRGDVIRTSN